MEDLAALVVESALARVDPLPATVLGFILVNVDEKQPDVCERTEADMEVAIGFTGMRLQELKAAPPLQPVLVVSHFHICKSNPKTVYLHVVVWAVEVRHRLAMGLHMPKMRAQLLALRNHWPSAI